MQAGGWISVGLLVLLSIPIVLTDISQRRIPNLYNLALAGIGVAMALVRSPHLYTAQALAVDFLETLTLFLSIALIIQWLKHRTGLGMGDVKFLAAASLWVGFGGAIVIFLIASVLAVVTTVAMAPWHGLDLKTPRPFAPMLAVGLLTVTALTQLAPAA